MTTNLRVPVEITELASRENGWTTTAIEIGGKGRYFFFRGLNAVKQPPSIEVGDTGVAEYRRGSSYGLHFFVKDGVQ